AVANQLRALGVNATEPRLYPEYARDYVATLFEGPDGIRLEVTNYRQERRERHDHWHRISSEPQFKGAFPYQKDVLALPVTDLEAASRWYCKHFGMNEVERFLQPVPTVILERDGTRIGFSINGGDASQDGAAVLVS